MRIWIDADACPKDVKEVAFRAADRTQTPLVLVANRALHAPRSPMITALQVKGGADVADDEIVEKSVRGDLCVTADIPLAARLVEKGVVVLDPRGDEYDEENVRERLSVRDFMADAREAGVTTGGPKPYSAKDKASFANGLDRVLQRAGRLRPR